MHSLFLSNPTPSGVARQLVTFFCFAKKKVTQEKATPIRHPFGIPCVARQVRLPHKLARSATRPRAQTYSSEFPDPSPLLGGGTGEKKQKSKPKPMKRAATLHSSHQPNNRAQSAHKTASPHLTPLPLYAASISCKRAVKLGEHCLSTWPRSGSCELRSPARLRLIEGTAKQRRTGVAFSLVTYFWRSKRK